MVSRPGRQLAKPSARSSRASVCLDTVSPNSSRTHWHRSITRQRTTPRTAGIGPSSTAFIRAARCRSSSNERGLGALPPIRPSGPRSFSLSTQSRTICKVTPPIAAASVCVGRRRSPPAQAAAGSDPHRDSHEPRLGPGQHRSQTSARSAWRQPPRHHTETEQPRVRQAPRVRNRDPWYQAMPRFRQKLSFIAWIWAMLGATRLPPSRAALIAAGLGSTGSFISQMRHHCRRPRRNIGRATG